MYKMKVSKDTIELATFASNAVSFPGTKTGTDIIIVTRGICLHVTYTELLKES